MQLTGSTALLRCVVALTAAAALALAGCSSATPLTGSSESQTSGSPGTSAPPSTADRTHYPVEATPSASGPTVMGGIPSLPGLSDDCSVAIHAQAAVNALFASGVVNASSDTDDSSDVSLLDSASPSADSAPASGITAEAVTSTFDHFQGSLPAVLTEPFAALRTAAEAAVGKTPAQVSEVLTSDAAMSAMADISSYITSCAPATSSG